ncbi:putative leader peptide [Streptomyces sp. NPDC021224]
MKVRTPKLTRRVHLDLLRYAGCVCTAAR